MKEFVRVIAEFAGTSEQPRDPNYKLTFDALLNDGRIAKNRYFGCSKEEGESWPFTLESPETGRESHFFFQLGDDGELREPTNVFDKTIAVGELFTRVWQGNEEWPYRIARVFNLMKI